MNEELVFDRFIPESKRTSCLDYITQNKIKRALKAFISNNLYSIKVEVPNFKKKSLEEILTHLNHKVEGINDHDTLVELSDMIPSPKELLGVIMKYRPKADS